MSGRSKVPPPHFLAYIRPLASRRTIAEYQRITSYLLPRYFFMKSYSRGMLNQHSRSSLISIDLFFAYSRPHAFRRSANMKTSRLSLEPLKSPRTGRSWTNLAVGLFRRDEYLGGMQCMHLPYNSNFMQHGVFPPLQVAHSPSSLGLFLHDGL